MGCAGCGFGKRTLLRGRRKTGRIARRIPRCPIDQVRAGFNHCRPIGRLRKLELNIAPISRSLRPRECARRARRVCHSEIFLQVVLAVLIRIGARRRVWVDI